MREGQGEVVRCVRCKKDKTVPEMVACKRVKRGYYMYCRECDNAKRRGVRSKPRVERKEVARKLPPYATLKRYYVVQGMSLSDIAEKYDVQRSAVYWTLRRRAEAYGDAWPLDSPAQTRRKIRKGLAHRTVSPLVLIDLVWDHIHEEWQHVTPRPRQDPFNAQLEAFCKKHGFSTTYLKDVKKKRYAQISKTYAARLMRAIGEPVAPVLVERRKEKYTGPRKKAAA